MIPELGENVKDVCEHCPLPVESMIGQGVINGEAYSVKKVSSEKVKVSERMAGPGCRQDGVAADLRHAVATGHSARGQSPGASG